MPDLLSKSVPVIDCIAQRLVEGGDATNDVFGASDKWYSRVLQRVEENPLRFSNWRLEDGQLYKYVKSDFPGLDTEVENWKVVIPKSDRASILREHHDPLTAGHMDIFKTYARITNKYYWPKLKYDVSRYVRNCQTCAKYRAEHEKSKDIMIPHSTPQRPWEVISTDLMGPFPRFTKGNTYILVVTDYLSKFSLVFPLRKSTTINVCRKIEEEVFFMFGVPRVIICENGPQYKSRKFQQLAIKYDTTIKYTANYHPRANPTERVNRTLKTLISMYVNDNHRTWDHNLSKLACALRTSRHETTSQTPYFINFGSSMCLSEKDYKKLQARNEKENQAGTMEQSLVMRGLF